MLKFDEYPESCPPADACAFQGTFYRLTKNEECTKDDFLTHFEAGANFPDYLLCEAMALSFYDSPENAAVMQRKFKKKFNGYSIKPVEILERYGIGVLIVKSGHLNLWEFRNVDIFSELTKEGEKNDE